MCTRKAVSPVIATIILVGVTLFVALTIGALYRETAFSYVQGQIIEYPYIYCELDNTVNNAKWKIELHVVNRGTQSVQIEEVFLNERPVDVYGIMAGGSLSDGSLIGTSLSSDGINLQPGENVDVLVWIGDERFSSGTTVLVRMGAVNNVAQNISVKLS